MVDLKIRGLLVCIIRYCERIEEKIRLIDKEAFIENDDIKEIVCFNIIQIGE